MPFLCILLSHKIPPPKKIIVFCQFTEHYERLTEVLYFDARDEYLSGRYLVDIETALQLVGLQMAIEFGPYSGDLDEAMDLL